MKQGQKTRIITERQLKACVMFVHENGYDEGVSITSDLKYIRKNMFSDADYAKCKGLRFYEKKIH